MAMLRTTCPQTVLLPFHGDKEKALEVFRTLQRMGLRFQNFELHRKGGETKEVIENYLALTIEVPRNQFTAFQTLFGDYLDKASREMKMDSVCD